MARIICTLCPIGCHLDVDEQSLNVAGNQCKRGTEFGRSELQNPVRTITSTVKINGAVHRRLPVKTAAAIPKHLIHDAMRLLDNVELAAPVKIGQVVVEDICGTGVPFVASRSMTTASHAAKHPYPS